MDDTEVSGGRNFGVGKVVGAVLVLLFFYGCFFHQSFDGGEISVADVAQPVQMTVISKNKHPNAVNLHIQGILEEGGTAALHWGNHRQNLSGVFDINVMRTDWYTTNLTFHYFPTNVKRGRVVVRYEFL